MSFIINEHHMLLLQLFVLMYISHSLQIRTIIKVSTNPLHQQKIMKVRMYVHNNNYVRIYTQLYVTYILHAYVIMSLVHCTLYVDICIYICIPNLCVFVVLNTGGTNENSSTNKLSSLQGRMYVIAHSYCSYCYGYSTYTSRCIQVYIAGTSKINFQNM